MSNPQLILDGLMRRYKERVPDVEKVISAMIEEGLIQHANEIENDHIAFRTIGVPHLGIQSLEKIFLHHGYVRKDYYYFAEKKLDAYWYAPPAPSLPRIFISELRVKVTFLLKLNILYTITQVKLRRILYCNWIWTMPLR